MAILSREDIFSADDMKPVKVYIDLWGGEILIRPWSAFESEKFFNSTEGKNGGLNTSNLNAKAIASSLVDEKGELLFSESDITKIGKKNWKAVKAVADVIIDVNKLDNDSVVEEAKN